MTSDDNFGLNLCVVPTTCYVVIILENQRLVKKEFLVDL